MKISIVLQTLLIGALLITGALYSPAVGGNSPQDTASLNQNKDAFHMDTQSFSPERAKVLCDSYQTWMRSVTAKQRLGEQILAAPMPAAKSREWMAELPGAEAALLDQALTVLLQKDGEHTYATHFYAAIVAPLCERGGEKVDARVGEGY